jgi:hypothetical protein
MDITLDHFRTERGKCPSNKPSKPSPTMLLMGLKSLTSNLAGRCFCQAEAKRQ